VQLIFILRNPVDRARSNFWDDFRNGKFSFEFTLSEVIRSPEIRSTVTKCGLYYRHIRRFREYTEPDQILFLLYEDLSSSPVKTVKKVYKFLNVDPGFVPDTERRERVTPGLRHLEKLRALNRLFFPVKMLFGGTPLTWLWRTVPHFRRLFWEEGARLPSPSPKDCAYLQELYAESNAKLNQYLDRDISHWNEAFPSN
jgi:hypothetical protein